MIVTAVCRCRPVVARAANSSGVPLRVVRPLVVGTRAVSDEAAAHQLAATAKEHPAKQQRSHDPFSEVARVMMGSPIMRMHREHDAMMRRLGLPTLFDDDLFDDPFFSWTRPKLSKMVMPDMQMRVDVDIEETDKDFVIKADTPGIPKDALKLTVHGETLTISGERSEEKKEGGPTPAAAAAEGDQGADVSKGASASPAEVATPVRYERSYGSFIRSFRLPKNVDLEGIKAEAQDGVLTVHIPKLPEDKPQPREIPVV